MVYKAQLPTVPKLYKVLFADKSCNGGYYLWKTKGETNVLPSPHFGKQLSHCRIGFHLTTDWRYWYRFGRDVYTATCPDGEILIRSERARGFDNKVVVRQVDLSEKNKDPLAKLLKNFYNDVVIVMKKHSSGEFKKMRERKAPEGCVAEKAGLSRIPVSGRSFVETGTHWKGLNYELNRMMNHTILFIAERLVKSIDETISAEERKEVHDLWNLWKAGWIVHGRTYSRDRKWVVSRTI